MLSNWLCHNPNVDVSKPFSFQEEVEKLTFGEEQLKTMA